jgi:hypothetical protein
LLGWGGSPGPFFPASENLSASDSSWTVEKYGILVLALLVYLSYQFTWSYAHDYHYFSPLGFLSGALFVGKSGRAGPHFPAKLKWWPLFFFWTKDYDPYWENLTGINLPPWAILIFYPRSYLSGIPV